MNKQTTSLMMGAPIESIPGLSFELTQVDLEDGVPWAFNDESKANHVYFIISGLVSRSTICCRNRADLAGL